MLVFDERVLLIHPGPFDQLGLGFYGRGRMHPPWGIIYVHHALKRVGIDSWPVDLNGVCDVESAVEGLVSRYRPTVVGLTGKWGRAARRASRIVTRLREVEPGIRLALGGPLASSIPDSHPLSTGVDARLPGDGEIQLPRWIEAGKPDLAGQAWPTSEEADLDEIGLDIGETPDLGEYCLPGDRCDLRTESLYVSAARGCIARCTFCYLRTHYPERFRVVSPLRLVDGLAALQERYDVNGFYFIDDCLISDRTWTRSFCSELRARHLSFLWGVDIRLAEMTLERLREIFLAGCRCLYVGIESFDEEVLRPLRKGQTLTEGLPGLDLALSMGFTVRASLVIGWPGQSAMSMERTLEGISARPDLLFDAFQYLPLPGTPLAREALAAGTKADVFSEYDASAPNVSAVDDDTLSKYWHRMTALRDRRNDRSVAGVFSNPKDTRPTHAGEPDSECGVTSCPVTPASRV